MNDLDTLRPEVRDALFNVGKRCDAEVFDTLTAELLRLARENDEWQTRCLQFQTERDHARQMHADRDVDVQHEWARAEAAEAELAEALKANRDCVDHFEQMQAELAALKARIFQGIVLDVGDLARGHAGLPSEWRGKRVRLVVEE